MIQATPSQAIPAAGSAVTALEGAAVPSAAAVLARAFEHDPMFRYIFPSSATRNRSLQRFFRPGLRYGVAYGVVHTTSSLAGTALWLTPEHPDLTLRGMLRSGMLLLPLTLGVAAFRRFVAFVSYGEAIHKRSIHEPHWYLLNLGVDPDYQGRGIGSALLQPVLARADARQQPCYLETNTEPNLRFYRRHGFEVAHHGRVPNGGPEFWSMIRPAHGQNEINEGY